MQVDRTVVVTPYGKRYHRVKGGQRAKHAACGGFRQTTLFKIPQSEAKEQGYSACENCDWQEVKA
ncbi:hypothetical protein [Haloarcula sp. JP-L23]|uniref:hypothetical protein n=1 Tax=Haloarcula sp. JP-L23 TaxID=2716717 RepID=UPI00140E96A6|nr:hypothetical protein G9465_19450 [Haloarcula sp. JP-L23]